MLAGGIGSIQDRHTAKEVFAPGTLLIQLGGPGLLIGMGGGAASSMGAGANTEDLDFDSVQRGNAEMQRRAQEVIDRCWQLGEANPILSIHDVGAGGLSNGVPEIVHAAARGARIPLRDIPTEDSGMSPREIWCNEAQERYVLAIAPQNLQVFRNLCERERCPFAVIGAAAADGRLVVEDSRFKDKPIDIDLEVILGKPPKMLRDVKRSAGASSPLSLEGISLESAASRVLRYPGDDAALYDTVRAVAMELCPALGISIPVGKDSLSMRTAWDGKEIVAPVSLIVSAFAPTSDARAALTPRLRTDAGETELVLVDLGEGRNRLGGSILAQVHSQMGDRCPDLEKPALLKGFFDAIQKLAGEKLLLAYHDRSDGGLFAAACEMAFAGHCGVTLSLDAIAFDAAADDVDALKRNSDEQLAGRAKDLALAALFSEELGALLQIRTADRGRVMNALREAGLDHCSHVVGLLNTRDEIRVVRNAMPAFAAKRDQLQRIWSETTWRMQTLRDNPDCAGEEYDRILDSADSGLSVSVSFSPEEKQTFVNTGKRPRIAILREQGVNGQVEMAAAFDRAGFEAVDVHMTDLIAGRTSLAGFKGFAAGGGSCCPGAHPRRPR